MAGKATSSQGPLEALLVQELGDPFLLEYQQLFEGVRGVDERNPLKLSAALLK